MGRFYTDEQIQEAIAALESHSPGIWEKMKRMALAKYPLDEEQDTTLTSITLAFQVVYPKLSFIATAEDKLRAEHMLNVDIGAAVTASVSTAAEISKSTPPSK